MGSLRIKNFGFDFRRKKKCIRLQIHQQQQQAQRNFHLQQQQQQRMGMASDSRTPPILDPNPSINELRRLIPTIGMDVAHTPLRNRVAAAAAAALHSPPTASALAADHSANNSDSSVRSPGCMSSLPSLGSPSSMASPSAYVDSQDWQFSGRSTCQPAGSAGSSLPSAFKPLNGGSAGFGGSRPKVGTDPRDSKNPLSVSQMTGNSPKAASNPFHRPDESMNNHSSSYHHSERTVLA